MGYSSSNFSSSLRNLRERRTLSFEHLVSGVLVGKLSIRWKESLLDSVHDSLSFLSATFPGCWYRSSVSWPSLLSHSLPRCVYSVYSVYSARARARVCVAVCVASPRKGKNSPASDASASASRSPPRRAILVIDVQSVPRVATTRVGGDLRVVPRHT